MPDLTWHNLLFVLRRKGCWISFFFFSFAKYHTKIPFRLIRKMSHQRHLEDVSGPSSLIKRTVAV